MFDFSRLILVFSVIFSLSAPATTFAYGDGEGGGSRDSGGSTGGSGLSRATTNAVVKTIKNGVARCQRVEKVYRFDCYRQTYRLAASQLNGRPAYTSARKALESVDAALEKIMKRDVDTTVPRKRQGFQTYRAIKPAAVPRATRDLDRALSKAETVLLRAPERTGNHYARIAEAVQSNKVLLRSRLYPEADELFQTLIA